MRSTCWMCSRRTVKSVLRAGYRYCEHCEAHMPEVRWTLGDQGRETDPQSRRFAGLEVV